METVLEIPAEHEANVFGQFDAFAKKIERSLHVTLISRDGVVKIMGDSNAVERARNVLSQLLELSRRGNTISEQNGCLCKQREYQHLGLFPGIWQCILYDPGEKLQNS